MAIPKKQYAHITLMIDEVTASRPDAIAISELEEKFTYSSLNRYAQMYGHIFLKNQIQKNDVISIIGNSSFLQIASILGSWKIGAVILTVDPTLPSYRVEQMLREANVKLIISDGKTNVTESFSKKINVKFLKLQHIEDNLKTVLLPKINIYPNDPAYIVFTSGSTGKPKGILGSHKGLSHFISWQRNQFKISSQDRCAQLTSVAFDVALRSIFTPLCSGASVVIPPDQNLSASTVLPWMNKQKITMVHLVPSLAKLWLTEDIKYSLPKLRYVFFAGEKLHSSLLERWREVISSQAEFINMYGPSETILAKCFYRIKDIEYQGVYPVGKALPETKVLIIKNKNTLCKKGETGEIAIKTPYRSLGYLSDIENSGFSGDLFFTGDLGYYNTKNNLEILGRIDQQIKYNGVRIEIEEIEIILSAYEKINDCAVSIKQYKNVEYLVAFIQTSNHINIDDIHSYLKIKLPSNMLPNLYVRVDSLPYTKSGKLDRKNIPNLNDNSEILRDNLMSPEISSDTERKILTIWSKVLNLHNIGLNENFFTIGGNSLQSMRILARLSEEFYVHMPLETIIQHPTIIEQAKYINNHLDSKNHILKKVDVNKLRMKKFPLSINQQEYWYYYVNNTHSPVYNVYKIFEMTRKLNNNILEQTIFELIKRYPILSTRFLKTEDDTITQTYITPQESLIEQLDCSSAKEAHQEIKKIISKPFDLFDSYPCRFILLTTKSSQYLILNFHHIVIDGWSSSTLLNDLSYLYERLSNQKKIRGIGNEPNYQNYILWQDKWLKSKECKDTLNYWKDELQYAYATEIPADYNVKQTFNYKGYELTKIIEKESIDTFCKTQQTTPYVFFYTALNVFLSCYTQKNKITIGSPVANRSKLQTENIIGPLVNTLIFSFNVDHIKNFEDHLKLAQNKIIKNIQHQETPFTTVYSHLIKKKIIQPNQRIFSIFFYIEDEPELMLNNITTTCLHYHNDTCKFDIAIRVTISKKCYEISMEYDSNLYKKNTIQNFLNFLTHFFKTVHTTPKVPIHKLQLYDVSDTKSLSIMHGKKVGIKKSIFTEILTKRNATNRIAIVENGLKITYKKLFYKVDVVCSHIKSLSYYSEQKPIAVCMDRSANSVISMLGILKAKGIYVPVNMQSPIERIKKVISQSNPILVITNSEYKKKIKPLSRNVINIEDIDPSNDTITDNINYINMLAYIVFTSGTTGEPKAILQTHSMLTNLIKWQKTQINNSKHRVALFSSFGFDVSIQEILYCLYSNSTLYVVSEEEKKDTSKLWSFLIEKKIDILFAPPQVVYMLCSITDWENADTCYLEYILTAGEPLKISDDESRFFTKFKHIKLINQYGPSETHVVTSYAMPVDRSQWEESPPIGVPLPNTELIIADNNGNILPKNMVGELYVAGANIAEGYYNNPEQTDIKFIKNLVENSKYKKFYKTGDLVKINHDNQIVYFGRADRQVKILGYRVELSDIEMNLSNEPNIQMCAVVLKHVEKKDTLVAYIVPKIDDYDSAHYLRFLNERLPDYMVPKLYLHIKKLPITENGKVDIRSLPEPQPKRVAKKKPITTLQNEITKIWSEILGIELFKIDINENFFELGGSSLLAVKMLATIERILNIKLNVKIIYENPSINQLASYIENDKYNRFDLLPIYKAPIQINYSLTDQQTTWWILDKISKSSSSNIQFTITVNFQITQNQLDNTLYHLAENNFVLRTSIQEKDGQPFLKMHNTPKIVTSAIDLSTKNNKQKEQDIYKIIDEDANCPIKLETAPLFRSTLIKYNDKKTILYFCFHHIIFDEWSINLFKDLLISTLKKSKINKKEYDYQDYAFTQNKWKSRSLLDSRKKFWNIMMQSDAENTCIRYDTSSIKKHGVTERVTISINHKKQFLYYTKKILQKNITTFITIFSLYRLLIYFLTSRNNCHINLPFLNRTNSELLNILGLFTNTVPINIPVNANSTFIELCHQTKNIINEARENIEYTFTPEEQPEIFNFMFVYSDASKNSSIKSFYGKGRETRFDITLICIKNADSLEFIFEYNSSLYNKNTIQNLVEIFRHVLCQAVNHEEKRIDQYTINPKKLERKIVKDFSCSPTFTLPYRSAFEIFETSALQNANKVAVQFHNTALTYGEVLNKSQQLAKILYKKYKMVGIFLQRGIDGIVAILGCLRAGIPYIPLDPSYPKQQLQYIFSQSEIDCILVNTETLASTNDNIIKNDHHLVYLDKIKGNSDKLFMPQASLGDLAYVIYTSGSTGKPKGVMVSHENLINTILAANKFMDIKKHSRFTQFYSINFDASLLDTFLCFASESTLYILDSDTRKQPESLIQFYINNQINVTFLTPALLAILPRKNLPNLHTILVGGDVVEKSAADFWSNGKDFYNAYGPTETTIASSIHRYNKNDDIRNIGKPLPNFTNYILNENLQLLPTGVIGEVYIGGKSVAKGYLGRNDLTQDRFLTLHHIDKNSKLYKTGDLAYRNQNGDIIFIGRNDSQIKFRGYRIELGSIEAALSQIPYINQCAVILTDQDNIRHLTAYYTVSDKSKNMTDIKNSLRKIIPYHMMPTQFINLDYFPITPNGKIDKRNLPKPNIQLSTNQIPPSTQLEKQIAKIWSKTLGISIKNIGITDNLYDLGGHSLILAQMVTELMTKLDLAVNYSDFMSNPTIECIIQRNSTSTDIIQMERKDIKQALSDIQFDFVENKSNQTPNYITPNDVLITGATGFVGEYLLQHLLENTQAKIHCLSRNPKKIKIKSDRIIYYTSDLAKPYLGLDEKVYKTLSGIIDSIYHCGAYVNHVLGYNELRNANVIGTKSMLELLTTGKPKSFYYISTISCAMIENEMGCLIESWPSNTPPTSSNGYALSKWTAEHLVKKANDAGYQCSIYRLGNVTGDSNTGYSTMKLNHIYLFLKGCLQMGYAPEMNTFVEMTPVDLVAKAIFELSIDMKSKNQVFHLNNPTLISWDNLLRNFIQPGNNIELLPFKEWQKNYLSNIGMENMLFPLKAFYMSDIEFTYKKYDTSKAKDALQRLGIKYPDSYTKLIELYDRYAKKINFF